MLVAKTQNEQGRGAVVDVADNDCERHCRPSFGGAQHVEASLSSLLTN